MAPQDPGGCLRGFAQHLRQGAHVAGGQPVEGGCLSEAVAAAHPQLPVGVEPEFAVLPAGAGPQVEHDVVTAVLPRLEHQAAVLGLVTGQVHVVAGRPEGIVGVIGPGLQVSGGDH